MKIVLDEDKIFNTQHTRIVEEPDFLLRADDSQMKEEMQERISAGERFYITDPIHIQKEDGLYLPICIEKD